MITLPARRIIEIIYRQKQRCVFIKRFIAYILILFMAVSALAEAPVAVRVGDKSYTVEEVQRYIDHAALNVQMAVGAEVSGIYEDREEFLSTAAEYFVTKTIVEDKCTEYGILPLSEDNEHMLNLAVQDAYEQVWQELSKQIREAYPDLTDSDRLVTETMEESGYSMDDLYETARLELLRQLLLAELCPELDVTDEEALAWYTENMVAPYRERYENNVPLFEQEILFTGAQSTYLPEGYFYVKYITLDPDGEIAEALEGAELAVSEAEAEKQAAYDALAQEALIEDGDTATARERYRIAEQALEDAESAMKTASAAAEEAFRPMSDVVQAAMNDGVTFEELIARYSTDSEPASVDEPGFPFHPDSEIWNARLREAIAELTRYGECTDPVYSAGSLYIVCRMDEMAGGDYQPDEEELENIHQKLLMLKQAEKLDALLQEWRGAYEISVDVSQLTMP